MNNPQVDLQNNYPWRIFNSAFLVALGTVIVPPYFQLLGDSFWTLIGLNEAEWSVYTALRGLFFIIFVLAAGVMGDFWGRRRILLLTLVPFIAGSLLMVVLPVGPLFIVVSNAASILGTMLRTLTITIVILAFEPQNRILPLIFYSLAIGLISVISPVLARVIGQSLGYRLLFLIPVILGLVGFWETRKHIPESSAAGHFKRQNIVAITIWSFGLCVLLFTIVEASGLGWSHPLVLAGTLIGGSIIIALGVLEKLPLPGSWNFTLYHKGQISVAIYASIIINIALYAIALQIFNFLDRIQDYQSVLAALALVPILVGAIGLPIFLSRYTQKWNTTRSLTGSLIVLTVPALGLSIMHLDISYWFMVPFLMLLGFGFVLGTAPRFLLLSMSVPVDLAATVQAIGSATSQLGLAVANSFMLTLIYRFGSRAFLSEMSSIGLSSATLKTLAQTHAQGGEITSLLEGYGIYGITQNNILSLIDQAYVLGLSRAMLSLAVLCLSSAVIVYLALKQPGLQKDHSDI